MTYKSKEIWRANAASHSERAAGGTLGVLVRRAGTVPDSLRTALNEQT